MTNNDQLRKTIQNIMVKRGFITKKQIEKTTWSANLQEAWKQFCYSTPGFSFFASKQPSFETLKEDVIKKLKDFEAEKPVKEEAPVTEEVIEEVEEIKQEAEEAVEEIKEEKETITAKVANIIKGKGSRKKHK